MNFTIIPAETWKSQLRKIDILFFRSRLNTQQQERNRGSQQLSLFFRFAIRLIVSSGWMARGSSSLVWRLNGHCWGNAARTKDKIASSTEPKPKTGYHPAYPFHGYGYIHRYIDRGLAVTVRATSKIHSPQLSQELGY